MDRGFHIVHQRVTLNLNPVVTASAFLTIQPTSPALRTLYLHATSLTIDNVILSSQTPIENLLPTPASYVQYDHRPPSLDIRSHPELKRKTWSAIDEREEGDLAISVSGGWVRLIEGDTSLAPIEVQINYHFTQLTAHSPSIWTPCIDSLHERYTWELEFIADHMVVASGELQEQVVHPNSTKTVFSYLQTTPTSVQHMGYATGPFEMHVIAETPKPILGFCLAEDAPLLVNSTIGLDLSFFTSQLGTYPFSEFKYVFLPDLDAPVTYATLSLMNADLLFPPDVIDQVYTTRQNLSLALVQQWIGINVIQRTLADTWLIHGLALYLNGQYLRHTFGNNEYRFRLKKDIQRCVRLDNDQWPICVPGSLYLDIDFINVKAPLVLHILDRHLAGASQGLSRVISRIFLAAMSGELDALSTQFFFKTCRKVSGLDLSLFQEQWVFGSGCPHFRISTNFIRKKFIVELSVSQTANRGKRPIALFEGGLTIRIHEADGAPFEHVVDVKHSEKTYNLPFNTKYKRTRRSGHIAARFRQLQEEMEEVTPPDVFSYSPWDDEEERARWKVAEWTEEQVMTMMGEGGGYEWIRLDPECEWIASFEFTERPWYWISQLQSDRDVVAQLEAIQNMASHPSPVVASELARAVLVRNYFFRVRMEAVQALVNYSTAESEYIGLFYLLKIYQTLYCHDNSDPLEANFVPIRNDFTDLAAYFVQKTLITTLANLRDPATRTSWRSIRKLLLHILQVNDNSGNTYSDGHLIATVVSSIGNAFGWSDRNDEIDQALLRSAVDAVQRVVTMDRLVPSYQNIITQAGLHAQLKLIMTGQLTNDAKMFLGYTREGNYVPLRLAALDCLLISRPPGRTSALIPYLVSLIQHDASVAVRRHVSKALSEAILLSLALGDVDGADDTHVIVKALRKDFGRRTDLIEAIQSLLGSDQSLAMIKLAEITTSSVQEPLPGDVTPKIRLNIDQLVPHKKKVKKAGLSDADRLVILRALQKLDAHRASFYFRQPVDPVRDGAQDYPLVIKRPMDLSTIQAKLDAGHYTSRQDFVSDIRLIISNCFLYNDQPGSEVHLAGRAFEALFEKVWAKLESTLHHSTRSSPPPETAVPLKLKVKQVVPPMAPPPLPQKVSAKKAVVEKKRKSQVDDLLGAEVDAMEHADAFDQLLEPKPKKQKIPEDRPMGKQEPKPQDPPVQFLESQSLTIPPYHRPEPPNDLPPTKNNTNPFKPKRARALVQALIKDDNSILFRKPVDPALDGCPTYFDEIKHPMDLGTVAKKVEEKRYRTMGQFAGDIELVFDNCRQFNTPGYGVIEAADALQIVFWREWPKAISPLMTPGEKRDMSALLSKALKEPIGFVFYVAVDPVLLDIPTYFDIIPPEDARDLTLIKRKLDRGQYATAKQVDEDIELMLENARVFNGDGAITDAANAFAKWWHTMRSKM